MSRLFFQIALLASRDVDQRQKLLDFASTFDVNDATVGTFESGVHTLTPSQANYAVPFGGVTNASTVLIVADAEVQVRLDDPAAPLIPIRPIPALPEGSVLLSTFQSFDQSGVLFIRGKVTSIYLTNPSSANPAQVTVTLIGEAT